MNNFDTVREALQSLDTDHCLSLEGDDRVLGVLTALTAIEADHFTSADMADAQAKAFRAGVASVQQGEPVADINVRPSESGGTIASVFSHKLPVGSWLLYRAAPVAQQYEAGDMASAAAQGFRDGVASVVQQPQARPDFSDEWTGYLKDGETPFERFLRERKDLDALTKLYQRALEENESLKAQQPQAEKRCQYCDGTGDVHSIDGQWRGECHCQKQPQAEAVPQAAEFYWLVEHFDIANKSTGHYYTGKVGIGDRVLTTMDPRQAQRYDTWRDANNASAKLGSTLTGTWRAMQHGFHRMEPQQAEAVPSDVVRDAERWRTFLATRPANTHAVINDAIDAAMAKGEKS